MSSRDTILARIRTALGPAAPGSAPAGSASAGSASASSGEGALPREYRRAGDLAQPGDPALVDLLEHRLTDYRARVHTSTEAGIADTIAEILTATFPPATSGAAVSAATESGGAGSGGAESGGAESGGAGSGAVGSGGAGGAARPVVVVPPGLPAGWLPDTVDAVRDDGLDADRLAAVDGVVTAAAVAVAETGTIVLDGSADQGRRVITLLPDLHICVLRPDQVVAGVPDAVARLTPNRPLTWISGPSATSDIELNRVEGVHGPRTLHVIIAR